MMSTFGELLRTDRERMKMSQEQLAKLLDVSQQAVANWEADNAHPRRERRARLLQILGPSSQLAKNPPRYEFIPVEDQPVSHPGNILRGERLERTEMATNPESLKQSHEAAAARLKASRLNIESAHDRMKMQREEFMGHLPIELRSYAEGQITVGAQTRHLDYLSPRWGIEIKKVPSHRFMSWNAAAPALLKLAVVRSVADQGLRPPREYSLILVSETLTRSTDSTMNRLMFDAGVLGITLYQVESFGKAADLVRQLETDDDDDPEATDESHANADGDTW